MQGGVCRIGAMEVTWYGRTCMRLRGKDAVVVTDPYQSVVGPTGRGITGDIVTFSHPDDSPLPRGQGQDVARRQDAPAVEPGRRVRARRSRRVRGQGGPGHRRPDLSRRRPRRRGAASRSSFAVEVDGVHTIHLGDIGHLLSEEKLGDIGAVDIACVPLGGTLSPDAGGGPHRPARSQDRRPDADLRGRGRLRRGARQVLPRDGRRAGHPAEALGDGDQPAERDETVLLESRGKQV